MARSGEKIISHTRLFVNYHFYRFFNSFFVDNHIKRKFSPKGKKSAYKGVSRPLFEKITNKSVRGSLSLYVPAENDGYYQNTVAKRRGL